MKSAFLGVATSLLTSFALAGPFGLDMGMTFAQVRGAGVSFTSSKDDIHLAKQLPKSLDMFEAYQLWIDPELGLCRIRAIGKTLDSNSFGDTIQSTFKTLEDLLMVPYGPNKKFDFVQSGSIWSQRNDWMMGLLRKDRSLVAFWDVSEGSTMKDNIKAIVLRASALSSTKGYIDLVYEFDNFTACTAKAKARNSGVL